MGKRTASFDIVNPTQLTAMSKPASKPIRTRIALSLLTFTLIATIATVFTAITERNYVDAVDDRTPTPTITPTPTPYPTPLPVNPPGEIPAIVADPQGNVYEVFTPVEGGTIAGSSYVFTAQPGDVPSARVIAVRMYEAGEASNAGIAHHRYTRAGKNYTIDAVNIHGYALLEPFQFQNPPIACIPLPAGFSTNLDIVRMIATDPSGEKETVLTTDLRFDSVPPQVCGYLGAVPNTVAVGIEGTPPPLPSPTPTPIPASAIQKLPVTGPPAPSYGLAIALMILGTAAIIAAFATTLTPRRRP